MVHLPWVDLLLIGSLAAFTIYGLLQGLVYQLATFFGLLFGLIFSLLFYYSFAQILAHWSEPPAPIQALAFGLILMSVWLLSHIIGVWARQKARKRDDWGDDVGGAIVGLLMGLCVVVIFTLGFSGLNVSLAQEMRASRIGAWVLHLGQQILPLAPPWVSIPW